MQNEVDIRRTLSNDELALYLALFGIGGRIDLVRAGVPQSRIVAAGMTNAATVERESISQTPERKSPARKLKVAA